MSVRTAIYTRTTLYSTRTSPELLDKLRQAIEDKGGHIVATYVDDARANRRGRPHNPRWKALLASLGEIDQVAIASAGDVPGRTLKDLLTVIACLREHGVSIYLHREGVDTRNASSFVLLDIVDAYRRAKWGQAIRSGQYEAWQSGKHIGRPPIPPNVRHRVRECLAKGGGIRSTAKKFGIAPASVVNIRRSITAVAEMR